MENKWIFLSTWAIAMPAVVGLGGRAAVAILGGDYYLPATWDEGWALGILLIFPLEIISFIKFGKILIWWAVNTANMLARFAGAGAWAYALKSLDDENEIMAGTLGLVVPLLVFFQAKALFFTWRKSATS